jgi:putative ABC transport system permease protein
MNLSTARSQKRATEVGVRKVMGAERSSLIRQFLGESFIMCLGALMIAILATWILLPFFNELTNKDVEAFDSPVLLFWIVGLTLLTGLLAGVYPAFYLSAFKPVSILKGKIRNSFSAAFVRRGLVVFQFAISICLVFATIVIWQQLNLLQNRQLGFNKGRQLVLPMQFENSENKYAILKQELVKNRQIRSVTSGSTYPGIPNLTTMLFYAEGKTINDVVDVRLSAVEDNYIEALELKLLYGRSFSKDFRADSNGIVLNEAAVREFGYKPETAIGKKINFDFGGKHAAMQIVGVVKDFNFESLHKKILPFGFTTGMFANRFNYIIAHVQTNDYQALLRQVESTWAAINPSVPFVYSFLDQDFQRNYQKEQLTARIIVFFTFIAILIACMGLFGLAAFSCEQRTKEIGIRKVLGASVTNVTALLSKEFIKPILLAIIIASPLSWYAMETWLQDFAYRISISIWMFVIAGLLAVIIALVTISFQAIKAAIANPVKSLRTE